MKHFWESGYASIFKLESDIPRHIPSLGIYGSDIPNDGCVSDDGSSIQNVTFFGYMPTIELIGLTSGQVFAVTYRFEGRRDEYSFIDGGIRLTVVSVDRRVINSRISTTTPEDTDRPVVHVVTRCKVEFILPTSKSI